MAEWPLTGRGRELAYIRALTADPARRGVVLAAPAGSGKTRLARECLHAAELAGMVALVATGSQSAAAVPFGAMASMLSAFGGVGAPGLDPSASLPHIAQLLVGQASPRRVFLLVDDAHLLDAASAALVHQLAEFSEVFLLLTLRAREPAPDAVTAMWKDGLLERIDVADLDPATLEDLLTTVLGGRLDGGALSLLISRSRGNMLFLRELVTAALTDGTLRREHDLWRMVGESAPSDRLVELVEARLGRLPDTDRRLLELLAIGEPLGARELEALSRVEVADRLEDAGLVSSRSDGQRLEVRLAHPVYGEVLRSRLSGLQARRLARSLAECLQATGMRRHNDVLRVGAWRLAGGGGRPDLLLEAATAARWQFDLALALRLAEASVSAGAGFEASLLCGQLLLLSGRPEDAEAALTNLCAEAVGEERVRAALARADIAHVRGRPHDMRRILDEIPQAGDIRLREAVRAREGVATLLLSGPDASLAVAAPPAAPGELEALPLVVVRALCLSRQGRTVDAERELAEIAGIGEISGTSPLGGRYLFPHSAGLSELTVNRGYLAESIELSLRQYGDGVAMGSAEMQMYGTWQLGHCYLRTGRLRAATRSMLEAVALSEQLNYEICQATTLSLLALIHAAAQRPAEARAALTAFERLGVATNGYILGWVGEATAWTLFVEGEVHAARDRLLATAGECAAVGDNVAAASALHQLVRIGRAKDAVDQLEKLTIGMDSPWEPVYSRHARAVVDHDGPALVEVSNDFAGLGAVLLAAEAAGDACAEFQRSGDSRRAAGAQRLAGALAEQCEGARTPALQGLSVRDQLTRAEQETARYAAAGHSNKLIAERLQLSVRTVEARLQSVYYKLGIRRREDLAAAMLAGPTDQ